MNPKITIIQLFVLICVSSSQHNPHFRSNHTGIVHLFEWKWRDVAEECEHFLGPRGYGGVQVSPANENVIVGDRPWWERYQPISYKLKTRSGTEADFLDMSRRCNAVGVRIYVDIILNHMSGNHPVCIGTGGSKAVPEKLTFSAVPYTASDFHRPCSIVNWSDPWQIRNCELLNLHDLDQGVPWVRQRMIDYLNHLVTLGVAGFRVDAAKHMWPADLKAIYNAVQNLNTDFGFAPNLRPFIFQEIVDLGGGPISKFEYVDMGAVMEFGYSMDIGRAFGGNNALKYLKTWGPRWGFAKSEQSLVFVDNHDNQRSGEIEILTYKTARSYKMAVAFMLAHPHGHPRVMSSFAFSSVDQGPPHDTEGNISGRVVNADGTCGNGWVCEHRWRQIANMIGFRNAVKGSSINDWWDNGNAQIAFCRGTRGFVAFNGENRDLNANLQTCLPAGRYCDVISGNVKNGKCTGSSITVAKSGRAQIVIRGNGADGHLAIHVGPQSKL